MKKIILIDFSKVISPIGISRFLAANLEKYLTISKEETRNIYKKNIGKLVIGEYSIFDFLDEIKIFLKKNYSKEDLEKQIYKIPKLDNEFLEFLTLIKKDYKLILISDIYKELGLELVKKLDQYFNEFIFSFEKKARKSKKNFWKKLEKNINFRNIKLFIANKKENIDLTEEFRIKGILYTSLKDDKRRILKELFIYHKNIILGAGASGILYGYFLKKYGINNFLILEKDKESLGLMKSFKIGKSYYDLGGHALHDKDIKIKKFLKKYGKVSHYRQKRRAYIEYKNIYIPFPFQLHLKYLPKNERKECFEGFMESYINNKNKISTQLDKYLKLQFGEPIYKYFLKEYNQKIWKTKLYKIATNWNNRIYFENIDVFLKGYLSKNEENYGTNNFVNYPQKNGFQEYINPFLNNIKNNISNNIIVKKIDSKNKLIYINDGIFLYENIISTIPINELIKLTGINYERSKFEYLSLQIIAILVKKIKVKKQRIYNKDKKYYFHKCVLNSNSSEFLKEKEEFVFQFENSFKNGKKIKKEDLINNYNLYLKEKGFIKEKNDILKIQYKEIKYGYPIQTINMIQIKDKVIKEFTNLNIYTLGRFGAWEYINFDKVILNTINLFNKKENENIII